MCVPFLACLSEVQKYIDSDKMQKIITMDLWSRRSINHKHGISSSSSSSWCFVPLALLTLTCAVLLTFTVQTAEARYPEQFLESVEVCAAGSFGTLGILNKNKIRLANFPNNTVSVKITRWEDLYASFYNYRCKFQVTAPKNMGVMMVIQSMKMRTRKRLSCRDYLQFQQDDGLKSGQICGAVDSSDSSKVPERIIGPRQFHDPKGELDVTFFTDARDDEEDEDPIALHLVFTAYRECAPGHINSNAVRQCSSLRSHSCISSHLFCDGIINCGFNDEEFGADEQNCGAESSRDSDEVDRSISIYVFAITTVATLVIVVILSLIVCCCLRKFSKQRRAGDMYTQSGNSPLHHHSQHLHHNHNQQSSFGPDIIRLDTTGPTAPLRSAEPSTEKFPVVDIDQPPPYDALFPSAKPAWKSTGKKQ